jgi:hypothetical protein
LDKTDESCLLAITDAVQVCNNDEQCEGFMINTDVKWQKKFDANGLQVAQLFGKGATYSSSSMWQSFKKQS